MNERKIKRASDLIKKTELDATAMYNITDEFSKDWIVESDGTITSKLKPHYTINGNRLTEKDWIKHLLGKGWVDMNTFIPAYFYALKIIGKKEILVTANYSLEKNEY